MEIPQIDIDFEALGLDAKDFEMDFAAKEQVETAFIKPKISHPKTVLYDNALKLARDIPLDKDMNLFAVVDGSFIFGDFLEAMLDVRRLNLRTLYVSTLGMSENNVDSLVNLMLLYGVENIKLIVSHYFFSVEKNNLIKYLLEEIKGLNFQVAVAGSHCKTCVFKTEDGMHFTIQGSANLSSNQNIEQFSITENEELYSFNKWFLDIILDNHSIVDTDKNINFKKANNSRGKKLWEAINNG